MVIKVDPYDLLIEELFNPSQEVNVETNNHVNGVAKRIVDRFIKKVKRPEEKKISI